MGGFCAWRWRARSAVAIPKRCAGSPILWRSEWRGEPKGRSRSELQRRGAARAAIQQQEPRRLQVPRPHRPSQAVARRQVSGRQPRAGASPYGTAGHTDRHRRHREPLFFPTVATRQFVTHYSSFCGHQPDGLQHDSAGNRRERAAGVLKPSGLMRAMLTAPRESRLRASSISLADAVATASSRLDQAVARRSVLGLCSSVADYYLGPRRAGRVAAVADAVATGWRGLAAVGKGAGRARRHFAKSGCRGAISTGQPGCEQAGRLPLPADVPHCADYHTHYDRIFAGRPSVEAARSWRSLLPLRFAELKVAALRSPAPRIGWRRRPAQSDTTEGVETLRAFELLALRRRAFVQIARDYNRRIARYTELVVARRRGVRPASRHVDPAVRFIIGHAIGRAGAAAQSALAVTPSLPQTFAVEEAGGWSAATSRATRPWTQAIKQASGETEPAPSHRERSTAGESTDSECRTPEASGDGCGESDRIGPRPSPEAQGRATHIFGHSSSLARPDRAAVIIVTSMGPLAATRLTRARQLAARRRSTLPPPCRRPPAVDRPAAWSIRRSCRRRWPGSRITPFGRSCASLAGSGCWRPRWSARRDSSGWPSRTPSTPIGCGAWSTSRGRWPCRCGTTIRRRWPRSAPAGAGVQGQRGRYQFWLPGSRRGAKGPQRFVSSARAGPDGHDHRAGGGGLRADAGDGQDSPRLHARPDQRDRRGPGGRRRGGGGAHRARPDGGRHVSRLGRLGPHRGDQTALAANSADRQRRPRFAAEGGRRLSPLRRRRRDDRPRVARSSRGCFARRPPRCAASRCRPIRRPPKSANCCSTTTISSANASARKRARC